MKTAERILLTALELFNQHGENSVTSVDIAMELDISPGNLYYHYKGKEVLIESLVALHKRQMHGVLSGGVLASLSPEDVFYYLYIVVEKLHLFRFLYRSQADLLEKYPGIEKSVRNILSALETQLMAMLEKLRQDQALTASQTDKKLLAELLSLVLTQSCSFDSAKGGSDETAQHYHALSLIMVILLPRLNLPDKAIAGIRSAIDGHALANLADHRFSSLEPR